LVATTVIHDGPHRGLVRQANHSADETTQRYPANPRVIRGYGCHLSGPSLLVSTHPSPGINDFMTTSPSQWASLILKAHVCHSRNRRVAPPTASKHWRHNAAAIRLGPKPRCWLHRQRLSDARVVVRQCRQLSYHQECIGIAGSRGVRLSSPTEQDDRE
jgi:hypothetical protein